MRNKIIAGNWKMNGKKQEIIELTKQLKEGLNFTSDLSKAPLTHGAPHHQMTSDASNPPSALHLKSAFSPCLGSREQEGGYLEANKTRNQHQQQINPENPHVPHVLTASSHEQAEVKTNKRALEVVIMPPALYIPLVSDLLSQSSIQVGAQNVFPKDAGAYTGELSAPMLKEYHCAYVLVGHSERRQYFHEDENFVAEKFHHVKEHGMIPVLCVGETLTERENGLTDQVITRQLLAVYEKNVDCFHNSVIAYEPVWAIGTGKTALPEQAQAVHYFIRNLVSKINRNDAEHLTLLYGGSVNENNARALFSMPDIDGGLVGGASLNAKQFLEIVKCIN